MILHFITDEKFADYAISQYRGTDMHSEFVLIRYELPAECFRRIEYYLEDVDEAEFEVRVPEHRLTRGKYNLDVWIGMGDVTSTYKYYDCVYDTLMFEVDTIGSLFINEWHSYWGENIWRIKANVI